MIVILMGVSGAGKSTIAQALATANHWQWVDADDFHPDANKAKMSRGQSLTDADLDPWLQTLHAQIQQWLITGQSMVLACSALKRKYRDMLNANHPEVKFVYLKGSYDLIAQHLSNRQGHFAKLDLLQSQFATLEEPTPDEAVHIAIDQDVEAIVQAINVALENK
jgi:gluconokinase